MQTGYELALMTEAASDSSPVTQKPYLSYEDFLKQYDGVRAEWFNGQVELLMTNNVAHNRMLIWLSGLIQLYLGFVKIGEVMLAGISMRTGDDWPAREPDLMIVLNEHQDRIKPTYLDGPADIVIEIVSPESVARDYGAKFEQYEAVGVREYWRFDPIRREADVYIRQADGFYRRAERDAHGRITSALLPGFALDPDILWQENLPAGPALIHLVQSMIPG